MRLAACFVGRLRRKICVILLRIGFFARYAFRLASPSKRMTILRYLPRQEGYFATLSASADGFVEAGHV